MLIPYGMTYTSTVRAQIPMLVYCEGCGLEYVYVMTRTAQGQGSSLLFLNNEGARGQASDVARKELMHKLRTHFDAVPCPACGQYQEHMIPRVRQQHRRWMVMAGIYALLLSILAGLVGMIALAIGSSSRDSGPTVFGGVLVALAAVGLVCAIAFPLNKFLSSRHYDPNSEDVEARKQLGQKRAVSKEDYEQMTRERHE